MQIKQIKQYLAFTVFVEVDGKIREYERRKPGGEDWWVFEHGEWSWVDSYTEKKLEAMFKRSMGDNLDE